MNKYIAVLLAVLTVGQAQEPLPACPNPNHNNFVSKAILDSLWIIKPCLKTGIPRLDVPVLDPLTVPDLEVHYTYNKLHVGGGIFNTTVNNIADLYFCEMTINFGVLAQSFFTEIRLDDVNINGEYDFHLSFHHVPFHSIGAYTLDIKGLSIAVGGKLKFSPIRMNFKLEDITLDINYESFDFNLDCESGCSIIPDKLDRDMRQSLGRHIFQSIEQAILPDLKESLDVILNTILYDYKLYDMVTSKSPLEEVAGFTADGVNTDINLFTLPCVLNMMP